MNYKKKSLILVLFLIISIQLLLLINNRQRSSFRYFIWNIQDVSIGQLICISFMSGLVLSSILNKAVNINLSIDSDNKIDNDKDDNNEMVYEEDYNNNVVNNESNEMPPERDLRDAQPTISVNYRVIRDNDDNVPKDRKQKTRTQRNEDDWINNESEW